MDSADKNITSWLLFLIGMVNIMHVLQYIALILSIIVSLHTVYTFIKCNNSTRPEGDKNIHKIINWKKEGRKKGNNNDIYQ